MLQLPKEIFDDVFRQFRFPRPVVTIYIEAEGLMTRPLTCEVAFSEVSTFEVATLLSAAWVTLHRRCKEVSRTGKRYGSARQRWSSSERYPIEADELLGYTVPSMLYISEGRNMEARITLRLKKSPLYGDQ